MAVVLLIVGSVLGWITAIGAGAFGASFVACASLFLVVSLSFPLIAAMSGQLRKTA